jgi:hypothetical protein
VKPSENWLDFAAQTYLVPPFSRFPIKSSWRQWKFNLRQVKILAQEIEAVIKRETIGLVWSILDSADMIYLTDYLMKTLQIQFIVTVWDAPEYFAHNLNFDPLTIKLLLKTYADVLHKARNIAVASEGMQKIYRECFGIESIVMIHGMHPKNCITQPLQSGNEYIIGFAGSLYCKKEWNALINCLEDLDATLNRRKVRIRFIGRFPRFGARKAPFVEMAGTMTFADTVQKLSQVDAAYLPYWFDRKHSYIVRTAFPSKLSAYVAAGVPVLSWTCGFYTFLFSQ